MTSRERFEAWHEQWRAKYGPGSGHSDDMLDAWEEAERQALERAARECESVSARLNDDFSPQHAGGADKCADAIHAMTEEAPSDALYPPCTGLNCGAMDGVIHSPECRAEHAAAVAGGRFVKGER